MTTTENLCACGRPSRDATICMGCACELDAAIAEICEVRGLAYDLDIALSRQARLGDRNGSRSTETPVAYDKRASEAAKNLKGILVGWTRVIAEETGADLPPDTLAGIATWLRPRVGWMRHHPAGAEAHDEIIDAVRLARRVIDRPAERLYAGPCDCGEDLYAKHGAAYVECHNHEQPIVWPVEARRTWLLDSAREMLLTTTEISQALALYAMDASPAALRGYVGRGRLFRKGGDDRKPLYRLGDVLDILARQAERVSA